MPTSSIFLNLAAQVYFSLNKKRSLMASQSQPSSHTAKVAIVYMWLVVLLITHPLYLTERIPWEVICHENGVMKKFWHYNLFHNKGHFTIMAVQKEEFWLCLEQWIPDDFETSCGEHYSVPVQGQPELCHILPLCQPYHFLDISRVD